MLALVPRSKRDRSALASSHAGTVLSWSIERKAYTSQRDGSTHLASSQALASPYQDHLPEVMADGVWTNRYFQEGTRPEDRDRYFTNRALIECQRDRVPIGVLRQTKASPVSRYLVLGLALVRDWQDGYFLLEGLPLGGEAPDNTESQGSTFDPTSHEDARQRIRAAIARRRGQPRFRAELIEAYEGRCAVTGCVAIDALEAAHIVPYLGEQTNVVENGLLLRADIHTLFDLGLISIDYNSMSVMVHATLTETEYAELDGKNIFLPRDPGKRPSSDAFQERIRTS